MHVAASAGKYDIEYEWLDCLSHSWLINTVSQALGSYCLVVGTSSSRQQQLLRRLLRTWLPG
jgi:hypothetical protein